MRLVEYSGQIRIDVPQRHEKLTLLCVLNKSGVGESELPFESLFLSCESAKGWREEAYCRRGQCEGRRRLEIEQRQDWWKRLRFGPVKRGSMNELSSKKVRQNTKQRKGGRVGSHWSS